MYVRMYVCMCICIHNRSYTKGFGAYFRLLNIYNVLYATCIHFCKWWSLRVLGHVHVLSIHYFELCQCVHVYVSICMFTCVYMCVHMHVHMCVHVCPCMYIYMHIIYEIHILLQLHYYI